MCLDDKKFLLNEDSYIEYMKNLLDNDKERFIIELCSQIKKLHEDLSKEKCSNEEDCYKRYLGNKKRYRTEMFDNVKKTDEILSIVGKWGGWIAAGAAIVFNFIK